MRAFGAALKKAREEAGITLEQIHERTRINLKHLRAIENGDFPSVPQTYVRAFIREYSKSVGLDENDTLEQYNQLAEEIKGIPKPPEAEDHSHLTPQIDDSVEIIQEPHTPVQPKHVEVEGKPEIEQLEFTLPVKRSKYVSDDHKSVDLPASSRKEPPAAKTEPKKEKPNKETAASGKKEETPEKSTISGSEDKAPSTKETAEQKTEPADKKPVVTIDDTGQSPPSVPADAPKKKLKFKKKPSQKEEPGVKKPAETKEPLSDKPAEKKKQKPDKPPKKRSPEDEEQRRILIIGSLVTVAIIVAIYGIWYFSQEPEVSVAVVDSTQVNPSVYAERFIDSTDFIPDEPEILPDTTTGAVQAQTTEQTQTENAYARNDSLVLEAFSSTPVYFSIRMDTTKTEKGFLSSNEHRIWKAKDQFVVSLGDAGAMTFFLNGKELRALGGEGLAINNHVINRRTLDQE